MCEYIILEDFILNKYILDNSNGLWYELIGDYYIPCLTLLAEEEKLIGVYGQRRQGEQFSLSPLFFDKDKILKKYAIMFVTKFVFLRLTDEHRR